MKNRITFFVISLAVLLCCVGLFFNYYCNKQQIVSQKPLIVTTTGMIADMVSILVGDTADVIALMGPGVDPHMYRARAGDIERLNSASLIVYNGIHLEGKMADLFSHMSVFKNVVSLEQLIPKEKLLPIEGTDLYDPHIWHDVFLWSQVIRPFIDILKKFGFDDHAIQQRAFDYEKKLLALDEMIIKSFEKIVPDKKILVTAHDAFRYFGNRYGVVVCGLQGVSTNAQAGLFDVQKLARFICEKKIKTIFVESCVSDSGIKLLQEAVNAAGWNVLIGPELYADALGDKGCGADTYLTMIQSNVTHILNACN